MEADAFVKATADSLPPDAIRSAEDRRAPIGKVFLFTTKSSVPGMYKALAAQQFGKSRMLFGWATTAHEKGPALPLMQKMNVSAQQTAGRLCLIVHLCSFNCFQAVGKGHGMTVHTETMLRDANVNALGRSLSCTS